MLPQPNYVPFARGSDIKGTATHLFSNLKYFQPYLYLEQYVTTSNPNDLQYVPFLCESLTKGTFDIRQERVSKVGLLEKDPTYINFMKFGNLYSAKLKYIYRYHKVINTLLTPWESYVSPKKAFNHWDNSIVVEISSCNYSLVQTTLSIFNPAHHYNVRVIQQPLLSSTGTV